MSRQRWVVLFSGRVQGVGFRQVTVDFARRHDDLAGTVRNLEDGKVELILEGETLEMDRLLVDLADHFRGYIAHTTVRHEPLAGMEPPVGITW